MPDSSDGFWGRTAASFANNTAGALTSLMRVPTYLIPTLLRQHPNGALLKTGPTDAQIAAALRAYPQTPDYAAPPRGPGQVAGYVTGTVLGQLADWYLLGGFGGADDVAGDVAGDWGYAARNAAEKIKVPEAPNPASLSDFSARSWYLDAESKIPDLIDKGQTLEQQARQAASLRNQFRTQARAAMSSREAANMLDLTDPNFTWEQLVDKYTKKGFTGDALYEEIIKASTRSRVTINESLGIYPN